MIMQFSSKKELRTFLEKKDNWKEYVKQIKNYGDRFFINEQPMTMKDLEWLMKKGLEP